MVVLGFGLVAIALLVAGEKLIPSRPVALLVVIASILALTFTPLSEYAFKTVGLLPVGLPEIALPSLRATGYGVPRLAGLPSREQTVAHWERASGFSAAHLPYYDVYAAWRMAYVMARIGTVFMERGLAPRESEMDVRNGGAALLAMHAARLGF